MLELIDGFEELLANLTTFLKEKLIGFLIIDQFVKI